MEAAWAILGRRKNPDTAPLREWAEGIRHRRGKQIAAVALARRLAGVLYAMWRNQTAYDPAKLCRGGCRPARRVTGAGDHNGMGQISLLRKKGGTVSATRCLAEVESRAVDGATAPSNRPSCAGELGLAPNM